MSATPPNEPAASGDPGEAKPSEASQFDSWLMHIAAVRDSEESLAAGQIHLLNTEALQKRMGEDWPSFADRLHEIVKLELKDRLGPSDIFSRNELGSYVIVFNDCSEVEARLKAARISEQILERLLEENKADDLESLAIQRLVVQADGSVAAKALESAEALAAMLGEAEQINAPETYTTADAVAGRRALAKDEAAHLVGEVEHEFDRLELKAAGDAAANTTEQFCKLLGQLQTIEESMMVKAPAFGPGQTEAPSRAPTQPEATKPVLARVQQAKQHAEEKIDRMKAPAAKAAQEPTVKTALDVEFGYRPMWHAQSNKIGVYMSEANLVDEAGQPLNTGWADRNQEAGILAVANRLALRKVRQDLAEAEAKGISNITMVPVHFSTLQRHRSREEYLKLCSYLPEDSRSGLCWEILGSHAQAWAQQMAAAIKPLKPFGRAVFLRISNLQTTIAEVRRNVHFLRPAGVNAIGVDVSTLRGTEAELLRLLEGIAELAEKNGLTSYGRGFESLSMTISAACMGYQLIAGPSIAEPVKRPECLQKTAMEDIYGRGLFAAAASQA
ncbi:hypothetical protein [Pelagibius sp.]|uniref:hypothetical protein n=1 Tax=Pelagibius sp. TaxID=1931238 RepID=UPI002631B7D8|nr:hypothetical protein [Pelagibius sp.]